MSLRICSSETEGRSAQSPASALEKADIDAALFEQPEVSALLRDSAAVQDDDPSARSTVFSRWAIMKRCDPPTGCARILPASTSFSGSRLELGSSSTMMGAFTRKRAPTQAVDVHRWRVALRPLR